VDFQLIKKNGEKMEMLYLGTWLLIDTILLSEPKYLGERLRFQKIKLLILNKMNGIKLK
jgi:hypothetical protein